MKRTDNWSRRIASCLASWWLAVLLISVSTVGSAQEQREYDFDLAKGMYLYNQGRYEEAERHLKDALNAKPGDQTSGYYLGLASLRLQRYRDAERWFREVLKRHPEDARARFGLGMDRTAGSDGATTPGVPTSADWQYIGHRLSTGVAYQPLAATTLQLAFDYYRQNYSNPNSFSPDSRCAGTIFIS